MIEKIVFVTIVLFVAHTMSQIKHYDEEWVEDAPFWKAMYWYLKGSRVITIYTIESEESDLFFQFSTVVIRLFYTKTDCLLNLKTHLVDRSNVFNNSTCKYIRERSHSSATSGTRGLRDDSIQSTTQRVEITSGKNFPRILKKFAEKSYFEGYIEDLRSTCSRHFNGTKLVFSPKNIRYGAMESNRHRQKYDKDLFFREITEGIVILTSDEKTFGSFLDRNGAARWNNRVHIVILIIPKSVPCVNDEKISTGVSTNILKRLWLEQNLLNVILVAPFSCVKDYVYACDPFAKRKGSNALGKIERVKIPSKRQKIHNVLKAFVNQLDHLNGYQLNVSIFERSPTLIKIDKEPSLTTTLEYSKDSEIFGGPDGEVLMAVSKHINFSLNIVRPPDGAEYGYQLKNGTYSGTLGNIVYKRADIAFNAMFMKDYGSGTAEMEFSVPVYLEQICIVVPKAHKIPHWLRMFQCFTPLGWAYVFATQILCGVVWYLLQKMRNRSKLDFTFIMMKQFLMFLSSAQKLPNTLAERFFVCSCLLFSIVIIGTFQGTLYESFTMDSYYKDIDTLAELDSSGILIGTTSPNLNNIFGDGNESKTLSNLRNKYVFLDTFGMTAIERAAYARNMAAVQRRSDLEIKTTTKYIDENGLQLLHLVEECPRSYFLVYAVPRGSVFLQSIDLLLTRMFEAGLYMFWYRRSIDNDIRRKRAELLRTMGTDNAFVVFSINDVQTPFLILVTGHVISTFAFFWERIRHRVTRASGN